MSEQSLQDRRILVVEDEYLIAEELSAALTKAGATVVGPVPTVEGATALVESDAGLDGAVLDVNLSGEMIFPVADLLVERGVPFVFATGYDQWSLPDRFARTAKLDKPVDPASLLSELNKASAAQ